MRNYTYIRLSSSERERYNHWKEQGDRGETRIKELLSRYGYRLRESTTEEDLNHVDFILSTGETIDVKNKKSGFTLELRNYNGNLGWLFTGADYIVQCFENNSYWGNDVYMYRRTDMVNYYRTHPGLFKEQYCERGPGKSLIWNLGKKRLSEMSFVKKLN